jgi:hypothetical protein
MHESEPGLFQQQFDLRLKQVAHSVCFAQFVHGISCLVAYEYVVVDIDQVTVRVQFRFHKACHFDLFVRNPLDSDRRPFRQDGGTIPSIEDKYSAGGEVFPGGAECCEQIAVCGLVADDVKERKCRIEGRLQPDVADIPLAEGQVVIVWGQ